MKRTYPFKVNIHFCLSTVKSLCKQNANIYYMSFVNKVEFGNTGLKVSPVVIGCITYGSKTWSPWVLDETILLREVTLDTLMSSS